MEKQEEESTNNVQYADLIVDKFGVEDIPTAEIDDFVVDYVLRCVKGPFVGNFIYLNLTEEGERIGGDENQDLTLTIENAGLSPLHCMITYEKDEKSNYKYNLRDLQSYKGTWIKIRQDSPVVIKPNMTFRLNNTYYQVRFTEKPLDEVTQWLIKAELKTLIPKFKKNKIKTLEDIKNLTTSFINQVMDNKEKIKFDQALKEIETDFPENFQREILEIKNLSDSTIRYEIGWKGAAIDTINEKIYEDGINDKNVIQDDIQLVIKYTFGYFWFMLTKPNGEAFVKLEKDQACQLTPDDHINIGSLEFIVQRFNTGIYQDQGGRRTMEDAVVCVQDIGISFEIHVSLFSVFDGHGGDECVKFVSQKIIEQIRDLVSEDNDFDKKQKFFRYIYDILNEAILQTDLDFFEKNNNLKKSSDSGSVSSIVLIAGNILVCANIGDCRTVISRQGKAINASKDHKPYDEAERKRVNEAGGFVELNRVNSKLGVSRAFGDFRFKKEENQGGSDIVSVEPEIRMMKLDFMVDEFMVIACDGLYDIFSSQQCVDFVRNKLLEFPIMEQDPQLVAKLLVQEVINKSKERKKSSDNVSVVIVTFTRGFSNVGQADHSFDEEENQKE